MVIYSNVQCRSGITAVKSKVQYGTFLLQGTSQIEVQYGNQV